MSSSSNRIISIIFRIVFFLIITSNYFIFLFLNWNQLLKSDLSSIVKVSIFNFLFLLLLSSIYLTIYTNPGDVPMYWGFRSGDEDLIRKRYCLICNVFKPERCHHCSICNKCILNMDHHCPWINSCIGYYNRKFFIQMLIYIEIILIYSLICNFLYIKSIFHKIYFFQLVEIEDLSYNSLVVFVYLVDVLAVFIIFNFTKFHLFLIFDNKTTIETIDVKTDKYQSPYDLGRFNNFIQTFGRNKVLWVLPLKIITGHPIGNGIDWDCEDELKDVDFNKKAENEEK